MNKYLTAEQAKGLVSDIVGMTMKQIEERLTDERNDALKEIAITLRGQEPRGTKFSKLANDDKLNSFTTLLGCIAKHPDDMAKASNLAKDLGDPHVQKALASTTVAGGGALIEPEFAEEVIELLRAKTVVMELGARTIPMDSGILNFGRVATGATATYRGEGVASTASDPALGELSLRARILSVFTPASDQLLNRTNGRGAQIIQEELVAAAIDKMDSTFLRSDGAADKPLGMLSWAASANKFDETNVAGTANGSTTAEITKNLGKMIRLLMDGNVRGVSRGWVFAPRIWERLFTELDANSNPVFRGMLDEGKLFGIPWRETTNIPVNLTAESGSGGGANASEVYLADFFELFIGETEALRISTSQDASYNAGSGLVSAWQRGETLVKVEMEHDFAPRHSGSEIVVLGSVTWGA